MRKYIITLVVTLIATLGFSFAASAAVLEEAPALEAEVAVEQPVVVRNAFVLNRRTSEKSKVEIEQKADYLGLILELANGDLVATGDDQVNFNLIEEVNRYNQTSARKLKLVSQSFDVLTPNEKADNSEFAKYFVYEVNEEFPKTSEGNGVVVKTSVIEEANNFVTAISMIKSLTHGY